MSTLDKRFPDRISFNATGGPSFLTDIVSVDSGDEFRNAVRQYPLRKYDVSHAARIEEDAQELISYFHVANGRKNSFPYKDWGDFQCKAGQGGFLLISTGVYQMVKVYFAGTFQHVRPIRRPLLTPTPVIVGNTGGTFDPTTGIFTGGTGVPTGWVGEFDVLCRFDTDTLEMTILNKSKAEGFISGWNGIPIVEVTG